MSPQSTHNTDCLGPPAKHPSSSGKNRSEPWRLIYEPPGPATQLLLGSEQLLASVGAGSLPALRWYVVIHPVLVIGVGQPMSEIDTSACLKLGISPVRRSSGGRAVLADDGLLNLDIALPAGHRLSSLDVVDAYAWLGQGLGEALTHLGWNASTVTPDQARSDTAETRNSSDAGSNLLGSACFGALSPYEVLVDSYKVIGLCQVRRRAGTLYQVGILLKFDPERLASLLTGSPAERIAGAVHLGGRAAGLNDLPLEAPLFHLKRQGITGNPNHTGRERLVRGLAREHRPLVEQLIPTVERIISETAMARYQLAGGT